MIKKLLAAASALIVGVSMVALAAPAQAKAKHRPVVALKAVHKRINAGKSPHFTYSATHVPRGAHIVLQRQYGTGHVWKTVRKEKKKKGSVTAPKLPQLGNYVYRLAVVKNKKYLATTHKRHIYAYGSVPFATLCANDDMSSMSWNSGCTSDTLEVAGHVRTFVATAAVEDYPSYENALRFVDTSCNAMTLVFFGDSSAEQNGSTSYLRVEQERSDPVSSQAAADVVGTMTVQLDGSTWYIDGASSGGNLIDIDATSSAHCYTSSGSR